jgi:hypothetical protein
MASSNQPGAQSDCGLPYCRRPGRLLRSAAGFRCSAGQARTGAVLPTTCHLLRFAVSWKAAALLRARPRVAAGCRGCRCSSANRAAFVSRGNLLSLLRSGATPTPCWQCCERRGALITGARRSSKRMLSAHPHSNSSYSAVLAFRSSRSGDFSPCSPTARSFVCTGIGRRL